MKPSYTNQLEQSCLQSGMIYLEELYAEYLANPETVEPPWRQYFKELESQPLAKSFTIDPAGRSPSISAADLEALAQKQYGVKRLIDAYRRIGWETANLDPLHLEEKTPIRDLQLETYGLTEEDLGKAFHPGSLPVRRGATLAEIIEHLQTTYCGTLGSEYMHIENLEQRRWMKQHLESASSSLLPAQLRKRVLAKLLAAQQMELFLHRKYVGQKRFSLEGGDSLIPLLDYLIQSAGKAGVKEMVIGMAHRGRLNVLINTMGKLPLQLFDEFDGKLIDPGASSGDVKYHKGFSSTVSTMGGKVHVALAPNPSHLEFINSVVEGSVRARQVRRGDKKRDLVIPVLIHGDAALAGQGVVPETINLSNTRGYKTGGSIHVVINNQIGFTTSDRRDASSMNYCTDIFKMVQAPVFHVNGDDPEAVMLAMELALAFRMEFHIDVVVDLICFRLRGHNEADEPHATQPLMYRAIDNHPGTPRMYADRLIAEGVLTEAEYQEMIKTYLEKMEAGQSVAEEATMDKKTNVWSRFQHKADKQALDTTMPVEQLKQLGLGLTNVPDGFKLHSLVEKLRLSRLQMALGKAPLDWGMAELLAYGSLLVAGYPVRLSGQDSGRGTFSHRHAVWHDQERKSRDGGVFIPLANLEEGQAEFTVIDSLLSEVGVLGFEYGYSTADPKTLVLWEAQFGDFANGAQVIIDQFITSGEAKWGRLSGLVVLLPHGLEGQGPEHSSARLERWLQLCAEENIQVCQPTTPAQLFHMLRRQMLSESRKPLIVMTPKSLLRHKLAVSSLEELATGSFHAVLGESELGSAEAAAKVTRVVACSGKIYYDLLEERRKRGKDNVALIRLEELYPFPAEELAKELSLFPNARELVWAQDEHENQGSWTFIMKQYFRKAISNRLSLSYAGRPESASPAVGLHRMHVSEQEALIAEALGQ